MKRVQVLGLLCLRCEHRWTPQGSIIAICPSCKSRLWDVPKRRAVKKQ
jgi:Zn finger protein HypA/HybF involved in hydrogenase expression